MATRTLAQFRAEQNIWRKDLADQLGITEGELERLELTGEVPEEMAQRLIESYRLSKTYFTEDVDYIRAVEAAAQRKTPEKPLAYFIKVSFVWYLLLTLLSSLIQQPVWFSAFFDYTVSPLFSVLGAFCNVVITAVSGIYLGSYLIKKTNFRGNVADFEFLYPLLPTVAVNWIITLISRLFLQISGTLMVLITPILSGVLVSLIGFLLQMFFLAFLLDAAALTDGAEKDKRLKVLCGIALGGRILSYLISIAFGDFWDSTAIGWVTRILNFLFLLATLYGVLFGAKRHPQLKKLWYTILPLLTMLVPSCISLIADLVA